MSQKVNWKFRELAPGEPERNPRETEFFRLPDPSDAFVREIIQNSLDAGINDENGKIRIKVRFVFGNVERTDADRYLNGLIPHLESCGFIHRDFTAPSSLPFLTVEDFGTTGLDGSTGEDGTRPEKGSSNFFDFWWREGISGKKETRGGRWGLGKTTFHIASRIRTFFGYTIRHDDKRELLMGKTLLKTHYINSTAYQYYGYFTGDEFKPISDDAVIDDFKTKFSICRTNELGLSLVIPEPDTGINPESFLKSVIIHFFYPIANGNLEIEIGADGKTSIINNHNLTDIAVCQDWAGTHFEQVNVRELMQFVFSTISSSRSIDITPDPNNPEITENIFGTGLAPLRDSFNAGNLLTFIIKLSIRKADESQSAPTQFTVHLQKSTDLREAEEFWFRSGIRISDIRMLEQRPVRAMVVAEDIPVATFLGDAETPAHTDWNENTEGFREKYQNAARILRFIRKSINQIVSCLDQPPREVQRDFLKEVFFVPVSGEIEEEEDTTQPPAIPPIERKIPTIITSQITGGFKISLNPTRHDVSLPLTATVMVAYDVRRGNPFKQYERFDFDLGKSLWPVSAIGCNIVERANNKIKIEITSRDFEMTVTGFDQNRDLVVKVMEV